jgi:chemotaxis protein CheD
MVAYPTPADRVFLYPATIHVAVQPVCIATLLGTCVAVCLWDPRTKIGGMNHYLLPLWNGEGLASPKYGNIAIEKLIEQLQFRGVERKNMIAKVFGGRTHSDSNGLAYSIGLRNVHLAKQALGELNIPILSENVLSEYGMNIRFDTSNGVVMVKYIKTSWR